MDQPTPSLANTVRAFIVRRNRLILVGVVFVLILYVLYRSSGALYPFIIGFVIAYLAIPLVNRLEKAIPVAARHRRMARRIAILLVYLVMIAILVLVVYLFLSVVIEQVNRLIREAPQLMQSITAQVDLWLKNREVAEFVESYQKSIDQQLRQQIEIQLQTLGQRIVESSMSTFQKGVEGLFDALSKTISFLLGIVIIPIWLYYVLDDSEYLTQNLLHLIPLSIRPDARCLLTIVDKIFNAFLRGQLILCIIVGAAAFAGLSLIGVPYAALLAIIAFITEAIPMIGPLLGMIPALLIALAQGTDALLWTFILYMVISQVEAMYLKARITGNSLSLHPALVMIVLIVGANLGGVLGMILSAPVTAIARDLFKYLYIRFSQQAVSPEQVLEKIHLEDLNLDEI